MQYENYSVLSSVYIKENPQYLIRSIDSMLSQTAPTDDYVIVKDGPLTEELDRILEGYAQKYEFIHIYGYPTNRGLGAALNFGLKKCKNELVARMDTDDIALSDRCEKELAVFNTNPSIDIVGTAMYEFSGDEDNIIGLKLMPSSECDIKKYARRRNPFNHPTVMYKKSAVINNGGYLEGRRGEDFALFTEMVFSGCKGININKPLLKYRATEDQYRRRTSLVDAQAVLRVMLKNYINKYVGFYDFLLVVIVQCAGILIPNKLGNFLYKRIFRTNITTSSYK